MTQTDTDGQLPAARTNLDHAITALIDPRPQTSHTGEIQWSDSLYDQLVEAIPGSYLGRSGAPKSQPPLWIAAVDTLKEIDTAICGWQPEILDRNPLIRAAIQRLGVLRLKTWRPQDVEHLQRITADLNRFTLKIEQLFTENHTKHLPAPCPACNTKTIYRTDDAGEKVRQPALQIGVLGCECMNCHHIWGPALFMHLARVLGYQLPEGVLE